MEQSEPKESLSPISVASEQGLDASASTQTFKPPRLKSQIYGIGSLLVRLSPRPHKSILVHSAQKNSHNFIVFAEMMQMEQKIVDFFSIKVYLRIKIWIQNQISKIINQKRKSKTLSKEIGIFIYWVWEAGKGKRIYDKSKT